MPDANSIVLSREIYKRFSETIALNGCSLTINPGEVNAIVAKMAAENLLLQRYFRALFFLIQVRYRSSARPRATQCMLRSLGVATIFQEVLVADSYVCCR